ncbi:MAG: type II secretion system secretin GspD [bacterium]
MKLQKILLACFLMVYVNLAAAQPDGEVLNLKDADINVLISTVSKVTGKTFIVDPRVTGKVTLVSAKSMSEEELYAVFLSVLQVNGYAAVDVGSITKILPAGDALKSGVPESHKGDAADALVTETISLQHVSAKEIVNVIRQMVSANAQISSHEGTNILVITDRRSNVDRLKKIIARIDKTSQSDVEIIPLEHAGASDLIRTLGTLNQGAQKGANLKMVADVRSNSIIISGDRAKRIQMRALIGHLDTPVGEEGNTQVFYLRYARAKELVSILDGVAAQMSDRQPQTEGQQVTANIFAHDATNSLVISAPVKMIQSLKQVISQLDIPRAQVLIEAVIAEVSEDFAREIGVQWQAANDLSNEGVIGGTNFGNNGSNILAASVNPAGLGEGLHLGYLNGSVTLPGSDTPVLQLGALVSALSSDSDTNIISTPSLVTLDNEQAMIQVGQEVPFVTGQFTNTGASSGNSSVNPFQTINRKDVGLTLKVTPHMNEGDAVVLEIEQEISSLAPSSTAVDLITSKRTLNTSVMINDTQMLVLGGLISDEVQEKISKVPLLGDIPVLGNVFRHRKTSRIKRNLMIFIRPTIIQNRAMANQLTNSKYQIIRKVQQNKTGQFHGEQPVVPELKVEQE